MNDDNLDRIVEATVEEDVDRLPRNGEEPRVRLAGGLTEEFRSIDARQLLATEDGVRVYLRDMAKTRLVSRTEELDLAYRIVSLRARFQSLLFQSRPAILETLRWLGERDDREASSESRLPFGGDPASRHLK